MYFWLVVVAFKVFGVSEFAARLPSAFFGVICVVGVYLEVTKLLNERTGFISGLVLATSLEYFYLAKATVTDITLTLFLTGALLSYLRRQYYLFYVFSALATLTKGPIDLLFPVAIVFIWMTIVHRFSELKYMKIPQGIFIWSLVTLPWYGVMYCIHGADFLEGFIGINNITRFITAEHAKTSEWYFFMPILILGFFPWTALIFQAIKESLKIKGSSDHSMLVFLNIWAMFIFVFFSISNTKLVTYILPVYPPLAILVGWYLNHHWEDYRFSGQGLIWPVLLTILSVLFIGGLIAEFTMIAVIKWGALSLASVLFLLIILVWYFLYKKEVCKAFLGQVGIMVAFCIVLFNVILPQMADNYSTRDIARKFVAVYDGKSSVYVVKFLHPGFAFYANTYGKEINSETENN
ncbi:MAG: hypothetical protein H6Q70_3039 [Firmicutes bacterium]|nr:hypothetical protein [Bacillota bacterium]